MRVFVNNLAASVISASLGLMAFAVPAWAQAAAPQGLPKAETTTFDDWQVRCFQVESPSPCDMFQQVANQQRSQRIMAISIAYVPSLDRYALQITVPLGISIPKGLSIQTDSYTSPTLHYRRCDRDGCYVETAVDKSLIDSIAKSNPDGKAKVNIVVDNGKSYGLTFFLKGFAAAQQDLVNKARAKAKPVSQPGATAAAPAK